MCPPGPEIFSHAHTDWEQEDTTLPLSDEHFTVHNFSAKFPVSAMTKKWEVLLFKPLSASTHNDQPGKYEMPISN